MEVQFWEIIWGPKIGEVGGVWITKLPNTTGHCLLFIYLGVSCFHLFFSKGGTCFWFKDPHSALLRGALECKSYARVQECKSSDREPKVQLFLSKFKNSNQSASF
jgi:hypothetical protein